MNKINTSKTLSKLSSMYCSFYTTTILDRGVIFSDIEFIFVDKEGEDSTRGRL
jgi:late competence protein required for DNA uptake (superfamily II DNA/RNA helicase)